MSVYTKLVKNFHLPICKLSIPAEQFAPSLSFSVRPTKTTSQSLFKLFLDQLHTFLHREGIMLD